MAGKAEALRYAVRLRVLVKYLGQLFLIIALLAAVPAGICLLYREYAAASAYFSAAGALAAGGWLANRLPGADRIQTNEAVVMTVTGFVVASAVAVAPLVLSGLSPADALFEAVSGITTTGLTMRDVGRPMSPGLQFGRAWLQWSGGLGIVIFSLVLILPSGAVARDMAETEAIEDDLLGGVKAFARHVLAVYVALTLLGIVLLAVSGLSPVDAVLYALAAVSTGGFAPHTASAAALGNWPAQTALMGLALAGALPMLLYIRLVRRKPVGARDAAQLAGLLLLVAAASGTMVLSEGLRDRPAPSPSVYHLAWTAFSAQTTAGFSILPVAELSPGSKIALIMAMFVGGGMGSTAGGVKLFRMLAFLHLIRSVVYRTHLSPHAVPSTSFLGGPLDDAESQKLLLVPLLFTAVVVFSWLLFCIYGYPALDSLFDVVSATGTVGLSAGVADRQLPVLLKLVLCADMLLGRLEIFAWLVAVSPNTWIGRRL